MYRVLGESRQWVRHDDQSIRKSIHTYRVGMWVLFVYFMEHDAFMWSVKFAPSGIAQLSVDHLPPPTVLNQVRVGSSSTLDGALREVSFAYRNHRDFMEGVGEFDVDAAVERANSEEIQNWIGNLPA